MIKENEPFHKAAGMVRLSRDCLCLMAWIRLVMDLNVERRSEMMSKKEDPIINSLWWTYEDQMKHYDLQDAIDTLAAIIKHMIEKGGGEVK